MLDPTVETAIFEAIDALNAQDPRQLEVDDQLLPYELVYGQRMSQRLDIFAPQASTALRIAARAQHLERWKIARKEYPMNRPGYLKWRTDLKKYHALRAVEVLTQFEAPQDLKDRVAFLLQKRQLKRDDETQLLEDVICHVFLEHYAADFIVQHEEAKVIDILQKTWRKMSPRGQAAALELSLPDAVGTMVGKALG